MKNKFSKIGVIVAALGIGIFLVAQHYWRYYDGVNLVIAPYYATLLSFFSDPVISEPAFTTNDFSLTEDIAILLRRALHLYLVLWLLFVHFYQCTRMK